MSRASVLARGRLMAEAGMIDTCTITRVTGSTLDTTTGVVTPTTMTVYSGPCRLQANQGMARNATPTPDDPVLMRYRELQLPVLTSTGVRQGDRVHVDTCVNDPDAVDTDHIVHDQFSKSEATARRLGIEEAT